ncbi:hypothetical protein [Paenibacillus sp. NPDC057967]|uniref:hypothetical protein n=1 Tax=Paenibacillus sp. NPDC057967 TaxID=3346293 RepID=UPI0036DF170C
MIPEAGDIYCVYVERLQRYAAAQITHIKPPESPKEKPLAALLELDWLGEKLPDERELREMKPLICNYFFWDDQLDHSYVEYSVPIGYTKVGNLPPLVTEEVRSYGTWHVGGSVGNQRQWDEIPQERRQRFKAAAQDRTKVEVGGRQLSLSTSTVHEDLLLELSDVSELEKLPCLTRIHTDTLSDALLAFIAGNPIMTELRVHRTDQPELDFGGCRLTNLSIQTDGLKRLKLNREMKQLILTGSSSSELHISAYDDGRWLTVHDKAKLPGFAGLDQLGGMNLTEITELDVPSITRRFPAMQSLRLWGRPGLLTGLERLSELSELRSFSTNDLFGFTGEQFPDPDQLPHLEWLWLSSLPAEAALSIRKRYKKRAAEGLDLSITKARKPEWLAENLNNPFRDWDGREHISAANARKAAEVYKKTLSALTNLAKRKETGDFSSAVIQAKVEELVRVYTVAFNKMDRRSGFIETVEREEIYVVLVELLQSFNDSGGEADMDAMLALFDSLREY